MKMRPPRAVAAAARAGAGDDEAWRWTRKVEWLVAAAAAVAVAVVVFGLVTGRLDRRAQGCCPADPSKDPRMRTAVPGSGEDRPEA
jgi:hypothetical protein